MRQITDHVVEHDDAPQLTITVLDEPGAGGANHEYQISWQGPNCDGMNFSFQNGPIKENGVNGVTQEALLAIVIDRLRCFQAGLFACESNQKAMDYAMVSLDFLKDRTRNRIARGVEGVSVA